MVFRPDKLTIKAQEALGRAQRLAGESGHPQMEPLHLLAGLLGEGEGIVGPILEKIGANRAQLDEMVQSELDRLPKGSVKAAPAVGGELSAVFQKSADRATAMKDEFISTEHSAKNLMIRAVKAGSPGGRRAVEEYRALVARWQVAPFLGELLAEELAEFGI